MTVWFDIPGCRGYQASEDAEILNIGKGRLKKQRRAGNGAMQVDIGKSTRMVHDLVARAVYGHPLIKGYRVEHLDGDLGNNRAQNLVWAGNPRTGTQPSTISLAVERAYERAEADRLALVELMM